MCNSRTAFPDFTEAGEVVMVKKPAYLLVVLLSVPVVMARVQEPAASAQSEEERRVLRVPQTRRRRVRSDYRGRRRGIRSSFKKAGRGAARGGSRFGKNIAKGRPVRGGKELGKGMGSFGKHTGKGVSRTVRRATRQ